MARGDKSKAITPTPAVQSMRRRIRASEHQRNQVLGQKRKGGELTPIAASTNAASPDAGSSAPEPSVSIRVSEHIHCAPQKPHTTAQQGALSVSNHTNNSRDNRHGRQPLTPSGARHRISGPTGNPGAELNRSSSLGCHPTAAPASSNTKSRGVNRPSSRSSLSERVQTRTPISTTQSHGRRKAVTSLEQQARLNTFPSSTSSVQNQTQVGSNQVLQERATSNDTVIPVWQEPIVPGSFAERNIPRGVRRPKERRREQPRILFQPSSATFLPSTPPTNGQGVLQTPTILPSQPSRGIDVELQLADPETAEQRLAKLRLLVDDPDAMPTYPLSKKRAAWELDQVIRILTHSVGLPALVRSSLEFDVTELRLHNPFDGEVKGTILRHTWDESWSWDQFEQAMDMKDWEYQPIVMKNQFQVVLDTQAQICNQPKLQVYPSSEISHTTPVKTKGTTNGNKLGARVSLMDSKAPRNATEVMWVSPLVSVNQVNLPSTETLRLRDPILVVQQVEDLFSQDFVNDSVYWVGGEAHTYLGPPRFEPSVEICQSLNSVQLQHTSPVVSPIQCTDLVATTSMDLPTKTKKVVLKIGDKQKSTHPTSSTNLGHHTGLPLPGEYSTQVELEEPPYIDFFSEAGYEGYQVTRLTNDGEPPPTADSGTKHSSGGEIDGETFSEELTTQSLLKAKNSINTKSLGSLPIYSGSFSDFETPVSQPMRQQLQLSTDQNHLFHLGGVSIKTSPSVLCSVQKTEDQCTDHLLTEGKTPVTPPPACHSVSIACGSNYAQASENIFHGHPTASHKRERKRRCIRPEEDSEPQGSPKRAHALHYLAIQYADSSDNEAGVNQENATSKSPNISVKEANEGKGCAGID